MTAPGDTCLVGIQIVLQPPDGAQPGLPLPAQRRRVRTPESRKPGRLVECGARNNGNGDETLNRAYRAAGGPTTQLWEIPNAGHTCGISAAPAEYERNITGFFDRALATDS